MPIILSSDWDSQAVLAIAKAMPTGKAEKWEIQAGKVFFKHRRAAYHVQCIERCYREMINAMRLHASDKPLEDGTTSSYAGPLVEELLFNLDGFFEAERSAHDFVLSCMTTAEVLKKDAPSSLHAFYNGVRRKPGAYPCDPAEVCEGLAAFWEVTGKLTKEYRDCLSHSASLSGPTWQHAADMKWRDGAWRLQFHLPDKPTRNSYQLFTFGRKLDALKVCTEIKEQSDAFLKSLMVTCAAKWKATLDATGPHQITLRHVMIGD